MTKSHFAARFGFEVTLGGTAVRAALCLARLGMPSTVHLVSISDEVREGLPDSVAYICSAEGDSLDPHVIVQFPGDIVITLEDGRITTTRPNRLILVNDQPNELMRLSDDLELALGSASAFLISGFNTMKSPRLLRDRLRSLRGDDGRAPARDSCRV